jgi:hypothetical protein
MYLAEFSAAGDEEDAIKAEVGCINTIASFARVDGLVLMAAGFTVRGFGVEITVKEEPPDIFAAGDVNGSPTKRRKLDFSHFGTRHRSMMRYCYANPGSVGFVVSQDGDIRAIARIGNDLLIWENIRLQDVSMVSRPSHKVPRK